MTQILADRIAVKLLFWLMIFCSILTVLVTCVQLYIEYQKDYHSVTVTIDANTASQLLEVTQTVSQDGSNGVNQMLNHLLLHNGMANAAVPVDNKIGWEQREKTFDGHPSPSFTHHSESTKENDFLPLGVADAIRPAYDDLFRRFIQIFIANGWKIFCIAGLVFLLFQNLVTRHLENLAEQVKSHARSGTPIKHARNIHGGADELDQVVAGLNRLHDSTRTAIQSHAVSEKTLSLFFDFTEEAILVVDKDGFCTYANESCLNMLKLDGGANIVGENLKNLFYPIDGKGNDKPGKLCLISSSIEHGVSLQGSEEEIVNCVGEQLSVSFRSYPVFTDEKVTGAVIFIKNNSEARRLRHERELLSQAVEQLPVMVIIASPDNVIQFVNHGVEHLTGYGREEMLGQSLYMFADLSVEGKMNMQDVLEKLVDGEQWEGVVRTSSKSGVMLNLYCVVSPVINDKGDVTNIISVCREISYELALQNELINAKKMEAIGRLSSSFAHEFGNPLFGVHSVLKDILHRVSFSESDRRLLDLAKLECGKMRDMVREFQEQYRDSRINKINQTVEDIVKEVLDEVLPLIESEKIRSNVFLADDVKSIMISKSRLSLVLRNIVVNAIESMAGIGGNLKVTGILDGERCKISIGDAGPGIKGEYQELVFEPFFSTKSKMQGAGLGLSLAYGAAKSLGGNIIFASEEGKGTVFTVILPCSPGKRV